MPTSNAGHANRLVGLVIGALAPIVVSLILVPFRRELDNANLALILVLVVVLAAILGGRGAGALAALMATLSFDFFLTRPYLSMNIETRDDIETVLILLGVGLLVGEVASRGRQSQEARERAAEAISRVHRVADEVAQGAAVDDIVGSVTRELRALLSLHDCWLEFRPSVYVMPCLEPGGTINQSEHRFFEGGIALSENGTELPVLEQGEQVARLVLIGNEHRRDIDPVPCGVMEFNPFDYEFHRDPHPTYAWLRDEAPAYYNPKLDFWALSRFDDVLAGLHDPATYTSNKGVALEDHGADGPAGSMIHMDPPDHTAVRKLVARRFTPRRIADLEPRVREWTGTLVNSLDGRTEFDVVSEFAARLPATVIATMLGIPADQHDNVRVWTDQLLTREPGVMGIPAESDAAVGNLVALSVELMALRRERPTDDILSLLVDVELNGEKLTDAQIIGFCLLLISGGHETTAKLIANGVRLFASHPDQRDAVIADASLMAPAVEELLRYTSPTQYMTRTTTRDVKLHGEVIPEGKKIALLLGSGNRDPREFDRPDEFDINRGNPRVLAFGHGAHVCLGAAVARLEARVALEEFLARFPDYDVDERGVDYMHSGNVQGPTKVPVTVR